MVLEVSFKTFLDFILGGSGSIRRPMRASLGDNDEIELQYVIDGLNGGEAKFEEVLAALVSSSRLRSFSEFSDCMMHIDETFSNVVELMFELSLRNGLGRTGELGIDELARIFNVDEISLVKVL